jgi:hypothetical protein
MAVSDLTTTETKILEVDNDDRKLLISVGERSGQCRILLRMNDSGDADFLFGHTCASVIRLVLPGGKPLYSWTSTGTAKLALMVEK